MWHRSRRPAQGVLHARHRGRMVYRLRGGLSSACGLGEAVRRPAGGSDCLEGCSSPWPRVQELVQQ